MRLCLEHIDYKLNGKLLFKDLSFSFKSRRVYSISGVNGVGKTTLLNLISGTLSKYSGKITINDVDINQYKSYERSKFGLVRCWQEFGVYENLKVIDNLLIPIKGYSDNPFMRLFGTEMSRKKRSKAYAKAERILTEFGLGDKKNEIAQKLSLGQKKILGFIKILMQEKLNSGEGIILMDEPFAGVHRLVIDQMIYKIVELRNLGNTILIVEHNTELTRGFSDEKLIIDQKKLKIDG